MKTLRFLRHSIRLVGIRGALHLAVVAIRHHSRTVLPYRKVLFGAGFASAASIVVVVCLYGHRPIFLSSIVGHAFNQPIIISFERGARPDLTVKWRENISGKWQVKRSIGGVNEVRFIPDTTFVPGMVLHAEFSNVEPLINVASGTQKNQEVAVTIEKTPALVVQVPAKNAAGVQVGSDITVRLAHANHGLRKLSLRGDIPADSVPTTSDDITFVWKLKTPLEQGKHYEADIVDQNQPSEKQVVGHYAFDTVAAPHASTGFAGFIVSGSTFAVEFDKDMKQSTEAVSDAIPGSGSWTSARQYTHKVGVVEPGKSYAVTFKKGTAAVDGGVLAEDAVFTVSTPGKVTVASAEPSGNRVAVQSAVSLTFDQPVDHGSAEAAFSINPHVDGTFSWNGNTLTYRPTGFQYQTAYTVSLAAGITPVFGLSGMAFSRSFTTTYETVKLGVPQYYQTHALSCEESSLRMALALYGIATTDDEVLGKVGYAPQPRDTITNTWQDPNEMFVGNVDGTESTTGWGAYAAPIAKAARSYGRTADVLYNPSVQQVSAAVHAGNPVVVWGVIGGAAVDDSWNTATSGVVHAAKNAHVRVVYGVDGTVDNPVNFYIHDPLKKYGDLNWSAAKLQANMDAGGKQAVVVK